MLDMAHQAFGSARFTLRMSPNSRLKPTSQYKTVFLDANLGIRDSALDGKGVLQSMIEVFIFQF